MTTGLTGTGNELEFQDIFWAGTGTTSSTVEWAMVELIWHPDVMEKAQEELDKVIGTHLLVQESDQGSTKHASHCTSIQPSSINQSINCLRF
jgi:hypothetical protein